MRHSLLAPFVLSMAFPPPAGTLADRLHVFHHENVLGTSLELKVMASSEPEARHAEASALAEIDRHAKILSGYDTSSEFRRWAATRNRPVRVSPELFEVLALFDQWREETGGALDAGSEAVSRVWKSAAAAGRLPSPAELSEAVASVRRTHWQLDPANRTATHLTGTPLMLNSFTKSYVVSRAGDAAMAASPGIRGVTVNIGGDMVVRGGWAETVAIADPRSDAENAEPLARFPVRNAAVATSGGYRRGFDIASRHYSHIVDPRTGLTADKVASATVIAASATDAGALATAFCVLGPEQGSRLAARKPGVEFLVTSHDGSRMASKGWPLMAAAPAPAQAAAAGGGWDPSMELLVSFELNRISDPRYRRPYLALWVEDKDKFPVRTVALWYEKPRWLPDLRQWFRGDRMRSLAEGSEITQSVSSATRPPGKYSLRWDGKDNAGKFVKAGKYTVCLEAAREHGSYQILRQEMDFPGGPKQIPLPGNAEIASAVLDYRKAR